MGAAGKPRNHAWNVYCVSINRSDCSKYAALISAGVYKAKKNKSLVSFARDEWKLTHAAKRGKLWMRHVKGHDGNEWNERADSLANRGRGGRRYQGASHGLMVD